MINEAGHILSKRRMRHILSVFRRELPRRIAPVWMCFLAIDYLYRPDLWTTWAVLRAVPLLAWILPRYVLRHGPVRRKHAETLAMGAIIVPALIVNVMIAMSGGADSLYVLGTILTVITGNSLFQLSTSRTNIVNAVSYGTAIAIFWLAPSEPSLTDKGVLSLMFGAMIILNFITKSIEDLNEALWASAQMEALRAFRRARRTEMLTVHFPPEIRKKIETKEIDVGRVEFIDQCVVGFADIAGSTEIANAVSLREDWEIKEGFINLAKRRAKESGMIVPTHTGDGCLFIANYLRKDGWQLNVITFFENLQRDYANFQHSFPESASKIETALRFGIARGPAGIGFLGDAEQSYYTAIGRTVNLAARLTARAGANEIVADKGVWTALEKMLVGWDTKSTTYDDLKGFANEVDAFHIRPRTTARNSHRCKECGETLVIYQTLDGFIDLVCPNDHASTQVRKAG